MIVKDRATLLKYTPVDKNLSFELVAPYLRDAEEQYLLPIIGYDYYLLLDAYTGNEAVDTYKNIILELAQRAIANLGLCLYLPVGNIQISDSGAQISSTKEKKMAFEWQINRTIESLSRLAMNALEQLIIQLEKNKETLAAYRDSEIRNVNNSYFIRTALEFNNHYTIDRSRLTFLCLQTKMRAIESDIIIPMITPEYAVDLKTKRTAVTLSPTEIRTVEIICKCIAYLTIEEILPQLAVEISPFGLSANYFSMINNAVYKNPASDTRVAMLLSHVKEKSKFYSEQLSPLLPGYEVGTRRTIDPTGLKIFPGF